MTTLLPAVVAGLATFALLSPWRFPWRVGDLSPGTAEPGRPDRAARARTGPRRVRRDRSSGFRSGGRRPAGRPGRPRPDGPAADLPLCCDLLVVAAEAGHSPASALAALEEVVGPASAGTGPVAAALGAAHAERTRGADLGAALDGVVERLGPPVRPLVAALVAAHVDGVPLAPALRRLADVERVRARRRVEERVRRLPLLLLVPLVVLVLPAFVVVTLVPVGLATARAAAGLVALPLPPPHVQELPS